MLACVQHLITNKVVIKIKKKLFLIYPPIYMHIIVTEYGIIWVLYYEKHVSTPIALVVGDQEIHLDMCYSQYSNDISHLFRANTH